MVLASGDKLDELTVLLSTRPMSMRGQSPHERCKRVPTGLKECKDAEVKAFAQRTLPVVIARLKKVKTMMEKGGEKKDK